MNDDYQIDDRTLFRQAVKGIKPLKQSTKPPDHHAKRSNTEKINRTQSTASPQSTSALSDPTPEFNISNEQQLWFEQPGLPKNIARRLRRGQLQISDVLDLHGLTVEQSRDQVTQFITNTRQPQQSCIIIIHGKGGRSQTGKAILKRHVASWLTQISSVMAYSSAQQRDGGSGALYVLLKADRSNFD